MWPQQDWPTTPSLLEQLRFVLSRHDTDPEHDPLVEHWPVVTQSGISDAGLGVELRCRNPRCPCPAGKLVALYPGATRLHAPVMIDAWGEPEAVNLPPLGVTEMRARYVLNTHFFTLDGAPELSEQTYGGFETHAMRWACAHRINHPPRSKPQVNVVPVPAHVALLSEETNVRRDYPAIVPSTLFLTDDTMSWVPKNWVADWNFEMVGDGQRVPRPGHAPLPVLMMVTTTTVANGQELFFNYRLGRAAARQYPWYHHVE
eukprot:COSAG02_NODE_3560_length_6556_cov_20.015778_1_plen_259_part_00